MSVNKFGNVTRGRYDGQSRLCEMETVLTSTGKGDGTNIGATLEGELGTTPTPDTNQSGDGLISVYYAYDDNSQRLAIRDDDGNTTAYIFDNQNRTLVERKGLASTGTSFSITGGDSGAFKVALRGGVTPVDTESSGTDVDFAYDPDSNLTTLTNEGDGSSPVKRSTLTYTYDALNRRKTLSISNPSGSTFIGTAGTNAQTWMYDGLSRLTECTDVNDTGTSDDVLCLYFYDSLSRKVEESQKIGASGTARATSCSYDLACPCGAEANPNFCIYPDGRKIHNEYDRLDRLISRSDVVGETEYDPIGVYEYIGKGRVAILTYQNNIRLTHIGQVSSQNADVGFDNLRRIVNHRWESFTTQALGAGNLVIGFEHQDGSLNSMHDRANNKRIEYKSHDPNQSEQYKYDSAYRLTSTGSGSQGQDARGFERGTFTSGTRTSMAGGVAFQQDWDLEGLGNWTRLDDNARIETRTHSDFNEIVDRVVSGNTATLTHDKNGNVTDTGYTSLGGQSFPGGGLRLEWDALNRLRKVWNNNNTPGNTGDDTLLAIYIYDCNNRRMRKTVDPNGTPVVTSFYYEGWRVVEERDGSDALLRQYTYGNYLDEVWTLDKRNGCSVADLNDHTGTCRHFYLSNTLYSVYGLANEGSSTTPGTLKEGYQYDAYGRQTVVTPGSNGVFDVNGSSQPDWGFTDDVYTVGGTSGINSSPYMFTGQRVDSETHLIYYKHRYALPMIGRFLSRDPLGLTGPSLNLYEYVESAPVGVVDPYGEQGWTLPPGGRGLTGAKRDAAQKKHWEDWVKGEVANLQWTKNLPDCPCELVEYHSKCYNQKWWAKPAYSGPWGPIEEASARFHPGAKWCIRSVLTYGGAGQQCCFGADGKLINVGPGAGTPDKVAPNPIGVVLSLDFLDGGTGYGYHTGHMHEDVAPFNWARSRDGGKPGPHVDQYLKARPPNRGKDADGKDCDPNDGTGN